MPVNQYALDGTYLHTYENAKIANEAIENIDYYLIVACCNGKNRTSCGYQWRFTDECNGTENIAPAPLVPKNGRSVNLYTLDGVYLNTFKDVNEVIRELIPLIRTELSDYQIADIILKSQIQVEQGINNDVTWRDFWKDAVRVTRNYLHL